ncbi:type IV secretion system protein TraC [Algicola sagamiensis]|uniref:type IV secretion system protein TraC n=1 Tax=Algicola sagamiensis TaxID=163869 RepID=UPI00036D1379|nr:type IV secretion system protein TraC [Algicola sagamiensis]
MGTGKIDFLSEVKRLERKFFGSLKQAFIDDTPPTVRASEMGGIPTERMIKDFSERVSFASILPYESYDPNTGMFYNIDTVGFVLYCSPKTSVMESELTVLNGIFGLTHKPNTTIQVSLFSDPNIEPILNTWKEASNLSEGDPLLEMTEALSSNRVEYLKLGKWDSLFDDEASILNNKHLLISYTLPVPQGLKAVDMPDEDIEFLKRTRQSIQGALQSVNIWSKEMGADLLIGLLDGMLNPSRKEKNRLRYDPNKLINTQVIDSDTAALWGAGVSSIIHDDANFSVLPFHVKQLPNIWPGFRNSELIGSFTNAMSRHRCPYVMTLTVSVPDQVAEQSETKKKMLRATQMESSPISKYVPQWRERKRDWEFAHKQIDDGSKMMNSFFQILAFCPQGKEQESEEALTGVFKSFGWLLSRSRYTPIHSFLGAMPMGVCQDTHQMLKKVNHYTKRLSWTCTNLAPWVGEFKGTSTPLLLLFGRMGQVGFFDNFDNEQGNYNIACCAASGGGKSFLTQEIIQRVLCTGGITFVIDSGHSYRNLNRILSGSYIDFGEGIPNFNPFSNIEDADAEFMKDQIVLLKSIFEQMVSPTEPLSQDYKSSLEMAIVAAWKKKKNNAEVDDVIEALEQDRSVHGALSEQSSFLIRSLYTYSSKGIYGIHFSGKSNIDLNNRFVVLNLDALNGTPDLQSVVLLIMMMRITQVMYSGSRLIKKMCIIDEAWRLLSGNAGEFIEEGYRVARKYNGCFMTITQKIGDYFKSETAQAAFMNSDTVIYLRQKPEELLRAEKAGQIDNSDGKVDILKTLKTRHGKYSEFVLIGPSGLSVNRFYVDPITSKLFSTKGEDVDFIENNLKEGVSVLDSITQLIRLDNQR